MPTVRLIGLPTDSHSSFLRGAAAAPAAIRAALASAHGNLASESGLELGDDILIEDAGDLPLDESAADVERIRAALASAHGNLASESGLELVADIAFEDAGALPLDESAADVERIRAAATLAIGDGTVPIFLGGDHMVSFPCVAGIAEAIGPVDILHFDAHPDLYDDFGGDPLSHASPFARIMEGGHARRLVQVGIRTLNRHCRDQAARFGVEIVEMREFAAAEVPMPDGPLYISIDLDALDPAFAPGVSHHEPGGLSVRELLSVLHRVPGPIVGADVVELNPSRDINGVTAVVAAKLVKELAALAGKLA